MACAGKNIVMSCFWNLFLQLGPVLDLWQQLSSSNSGLLRTNREVVQGKGHQAEAQSNSIDDFVHLENDLSCQMCVVVDNSIASLKKVKACSVSLIYLKNVGIIWIRITHSCYSRSCCISTVRKCAF